MNIRQWPLNKIMQLPDWCFGRKWPVMLELFEAVPGTFWDISEIALPERCVLWQFIYYTVHLGAVPQTWRLALGDQLPTAVAQMTALDPLIHGLGVQGPEPRQINMNVDHNRMSIDFRMPIEANGRRPILEVTVGELAGALVRVGLVFSSVPMEVPDWLVSA